MWHGMLFARWTGKNWFRYIVIREHEFRDVNWDLHLGFPFVLFGCILNIAQSSFANYMLCQSAKIMKLLLLSLLFLVRLVWKMPSLLSAILFAIYWLSQNERKYGTPAAESIQYASQRGMRAMRGRRARRASHARHASQTCEACEASLIWKKKIVSCKKAWDDAV